MIALFGPYRYSKFSYARKDRAYMLLFTAFIFLCMTVLIPGCTQKPSLFPEIPDASDSAIVSSFPSEPVPSTTENAPEIIRIAAPFSQETMTFLVRLYTAKKYESLGMGVTGQTVSLDYLSTVQPEFAVEVINTSITGADYSSIMNWSKSGTVPDIMLTDSIAELTDRGFVLPMDQYLAKNDLVLPSHAYYDMLTLFEKSGKRYGIPFSASVAVIFYNSEILNKTGIPVSFEPDMEVLMEYASFIHRYNEDQSDPESAVFPFFSASELFPYLPSSFDSDAKYFAFEEGYIDVDSDAFIKSIEYIRSYKSHSFIEGLTAEEISEYFGALHPIIAKRVAFWAGRSDEVSRWANYMPHTLGLAPIPNDLGLESGPFAVTVYPLCVSSDTLHPGYSVDFATFISLDADAILLRLRLENHEGFIPVIKSPEVWMATFADATYCGPLVTLKDSMDWAYYTPIGNNPAFLTETEMFLGEYGDLLFFENTNIDEILESYRENRDIYGG